MAECIRCGKDLTNNEIGVYRKLVNRDSREFLCQECLAARLDISVGDIERKIRQFRQQGCTLFV